MDNYERFKEYLAIALERFKEIDKKETIRLVSHLDADGIAAVSIMMKALNLDNRKYSISIVQQLTADVVRSLAKEPYNNYVFTDLGSGQLSDIKKHLAGKNVFIFDHHQPDDEKAANIVHVNPHLFGIDGSGEISASGVVYLFARCLNKKVEELAAYLTKELPNHIYKEDNILYPMATQVIPNEKWEGMKRECDKIGYCCFTLEI